MPALYQEFSPPAHLKIPHVENRKLWISNRNNLILIKVVLKDTITMTEATPEVNAEVYSCTGICLKHPANFNHK